MSTNDKLFEVYEAVEDGMLLFKAPMNELCNVFTIKRDSIVRSIRLGQIVEKRYNIVDPDNPVKLNKNKEYGVYDLDDGDLLVCVGTKSDIMDFLEVKDTTFYDATRGILVNKRYKVERL